jgi:hypothetical protein
VEQTAGWPMKFRDLVERMLATAFESVGARNQYYSIEVFLIPSHTYCIELMII